MAEDKILRKLSEMETSFSKMEENTNKRFSLIDKELSNMKTSMGHMEGELSDIKASTKRIEENVSEDVVTILKVMDRKMEKRDSDTVVLNNRLFKVESTVESLLDKQNSL